MNVYICQFPEENNMCCLQLLAKSWLSSEKIDRVVLFSKDIFLEYLDQNY